MVRTCSRFVQVSAVLLALSTGGCFGGGEGRQMRNGEDVLVAGGSPTVRAWTAFPATRSSPAARSRSKA
jgi:hypothetical protein